MCVCVCVCVCVKLTACCRRCPVCPNISLIALTGSLCPDNGEIVVVRSSSVSFNCSYDNPVLGPTDYAWYLDGVRQTAFNSYSADIPVSTGSHVVECRAMISETADCTCEDSRTINVTAIGTQSKRDSIAILRRCFGCETFQP